MQTDIFDIYPPEQDNPEQEVVSPVQEDNTLTLDDPAISAIEQERQTAIDNINANYEQLAQQLEQQPNPADAIFATIQRRKVVDPRVVNARRNLGSLYDAFQTLGTLAAMNGRTTLPTPPAPAIHPATAEQNQLADRLAALQLDADNQYFSALRNAQAQKNQFERNRSNQLASLRRQQQREIDDANTFHTRRADAVRKQQKDIEARIELQELRQQHAEYMRSLPRTSSRSSSRRKASDYFEIDYNGYSHFIPKTSRGNINAAAQSILNELSYLERRDYEGNFTDYNSRAINVIQRAAESSNPVIAQIAIDALIGNTEFYEEANSYAPYTVTPAVESPAAQPTSLTPPSQTTIPRAWDLKN